MLLALFLGSISLSAYLHLGALGKTALEKNRGRLLNPIQVVNFPQDACVVNVGGLDTTGVCLSGSECNARSGIIIGQFRYNFKNSNTSDFQMNYLSDVTIAMTVLSTLVFTSQEVALKGSVPAAPSWWTTARAATSRRTSRTSSTPASQAPTHRLQPHANTLFQR